jgi:AcrR family transcriptional regulator
MNQPQDRPYHHGQLRRALLDAAVEEVHRVGASSVSMRNVARRAGVSHAAPVHHFGDKAGLFTAIATEGFELAVEMIAPAARSASAFLDGGAAYILFALDHPGHYQVMFRPDLYHPEDPGLRAARDAAFDLLHRSAVDSLPPEPEADAADLALVGWSLTHGFATLLLTGNLEDRVGTLEDTTQRWLRGLALLGAIATDRIAADSARN